MKTESAVLLSFDYQYDGNENRTVKTGIQGLTTGSSALDIRYQYDVRGQLLEEFWSGVAVRYAYDAAGNRIQKTEGEKESRYRYNQKNQLLQKEDGDGINCFTYDRQGGIIEEKTAVSPTTASTSRHRQRPKQEKSRKTSMMRRGCAMSWSRTAGGPASYTIMESSCMRKERKQGYPRKQPAIIWVQGLKRFSETVKPSIIIRMNNWIPHWYLMKTQQAGIIISMMPLVQDWKQQKHYPTESATQASSMTSRQSSIICERGTTIRYLDCLCRRMCIRGWTESIYILC